MNFDFDNVKESLVVDEGLRLKPYTDTRNKFTIGIGRNLTDNGLSHEEVMYLLDNDLKRVYEELTHFVWFDALSDNRKNALINMCFNIGLSKFVGFKNMLAALKAGDFSRASDEMLNSDWVNQVGERAHRLARMIKEDVPS